MSTERKTLDEQLSSLPIKEKENSVEKERLHRGLQDGGVKAVTLQKTFVPAHEISRYVIVEHVVGQPGSNNNTHVHNELSDHVLFEDAQRSFREKVYNNQFAIQSTDALRELLLVGKFGTGKLTYSNDGELVKTSGITLDYALTLPGRSYNLQSSRDPYEPVTLQDKMFASVDIKTNIIQFLDQSLNKVTINDFWNQSEGATVNKMKIPPKEIEHIDLLPKQSFNQNRNGMKQ